ncbi:MAG TPA: hypothetical protein VF034_12355 [Gemmatimonadaceae bacterium]
MMNRPQHARRFTITALTGLLGVAAIASVASAQHKPRIGRAASPPPPPPQMTVPYPGATVTVDPQLQQLWYQQNLRQRNPLPHHRPPYDGGAAQVYYVPYPVYPSYGGGVTDANGRPLYIETAPTQGGGGGFGLGTPDLSGTPYVVDQDGRMVVDFGRGVRTIPSCAAESAERAPDGRPRTIFYQPAAGGVVLRQGQRGRVIGVPPDDAKACYLVDAYGRMAVDW